MLFFYINLNFKLYLIYFFKKDILHLILKTLIIKN